MKTNRILALLLTLCLALSLASNALAASSFPTVNTYSPGYYRDVPDGEWYAEAAKLCYEADLITGTKANTFSPNNAVSISEAAAIAARILASVNGQTIREARSGEAWYQRYVDFLDSNGVAVPDPLQNASRAQLFQLLAAVVPVSQLPAINSIQTLPDTDDPDVLRFYNAGILTGTDGTGTFLGSRGLKRNECATMVARIIDPSLRQKFTPQASSAAAQTPAVSAETELLSTEALRVNGVSVSFQTYLDALNACVAQTDANLKSQNGVGLSWTTKYADVDDLEQYFKDLALSELVESTLIEAQAKALGCTVEALPAVLTPDPSKDLDKIYCAKHILVDDEQTAKAIIALLQQSPSEDLFNQLMAQYGTDPGMQSDPRGYIFTDGDMVSEFENAVKALHIGSCSMVPVRSSFGYHVIFRLDPTTRSGWQQAWQERKYEDFLSSWVSSATVTPNTAELNKINVQARYNDYLASLGG